MVTFIESLVDSINKNLKSGLILLGFAVIFLIVVVVLINSTIKLALFSWRFLIRSMQLVGATCGFIKIFYKGFFIVLQNDNAFKLIHFMQAMADHNCCCGVFI